MPFAQFPAAGTWGPWVASPALLALLNWPELGLCRSAPLFAGGESIFFFCHTKSTQEKYFRGVELPVAAATKFPAPRTYVGAGRMEGDGGGKTDADPYQAAATPKMHCNYSASANSPSLPIGKTLGVAKIP
jgi:hypothetical protein